MVAYRHSFSPIDIPIDHQKRMFSLGFLGYLHNIVSNIKFSRAYVTELFPTNLVDATLYKQFPSKNHQQW